MDGYSELLNNPSGLNSNPSGRIFDAKSDKISTFFKKSGSEMTTYYICWAKTRTKTKKNFPARNAPPTQVLILKSEFYFEIIIIIWGLPYLNRKYKTNTTFLNLY